MREIVKWRGALHGSAVLNYAGAMGEFDGYAKAFHLAARDLVEAFKQKQSYSDYEVCPVLFLYRHACELYMKGILFDGSIVMSMEGANGVFEESHLRQHRLDALLGPLMKVAKHVKWNPNEIAEGWPLGFKDLVRHIDGIDPLSYTFRYPVDTKGNASTDVHYHVQVFDYAVFAESLISGFENLHDTIWATYDWLCQMRDSMPSP